jgi:hypothetical protein
MPIIVLLRCFSLCAVAAAAGFAALASAFCAEGAWAVQDMLQAIAVNRAAERMTDGIAMKLLE